MATENIINVIFRASVEQLINRVNEASSAVMNIGQEALKSANEFVRGFTGADAKTETLNASIKQTQINLNALSNTGTKIGQNLANGFNRGADASKVSTLAIIDRLKSIQQASTKSGTDLSKFTEEMNRSYRNTRNTNSEVNNLKYAVMSLVSAYAGKKILDFTIGAAFDREQIEMQYEVLLKSVAAAKDRVQEITKFAEVTPFEMPELLRMDKILQTYNIRTMDWIKTIGDTAAALEDPKEKLLEISTYLGRIAAGQTGRALERFEELGIITRARLKEMGLIFDAQNAYKGKISDLMNAISTELNSKYGDMMVKLSQTGVGLQSTLSDTVKAFGRDIGMGALENAKGSIRDLIGLFEELREKGTLDSLSQSLGSILSKIIQWFRELMSNADKTIESIDDFAENIETNFNKIKTTVELGIDAWIAYKAALLIAPLIQGLIVVIGILNGSIKAATVVQWLWNVALNANPIGIIITLIGALIFAILRLNKDNDFVTKSISTAWEVVKLSFLVFAKIFLYYINVQIKTWQFFLGWIPGLGKAFDTAADFANKALKSIDKQIDTTKAKMQDLWSTAEKGAKTNIWGTDEEFNIAKMKAEQRVYDKQKTTKEEIPTPSGTPSTTTKDTRTYAEKQIDAITEKYENQIDVLESRASLLEAQKRPEEAKAQTQNLLGALTQKAADLLRAQTGAKTTKDINIIETARNKLISEILKVTESINQGITEMVGSFNVPELVAMTQYQYQTTQGDTITKQMTIEPKVAVYVTTSGTDKESEEKLKSSGKNLGKSFYSGLKDGLVSEFEADERRN